MQNRIASGCKIRRVFAALLAACAASAAAVRPAAAEVFEGNVLLETQAQVDNFVYTEVTGYLSIRDDGTDPITNLDGLSGLTSVRGLSIYRNDSLTNVDGLSGLGSVGSLYISHNDSLTNVDGLSGLTSVGTLYITDNDSLTDVDGLSGITWVAVDLWIVANDLLTDVDGLSGLTSVHNLLIVGNALLTDVDGLSGITSVSGYLRIYNNESLTEFCGLYPLLAAGGLAGSYFVNFNAANPTADDILNGGPCDPADTIGKLLAEHAINKREARTLLELADNSLEDLADLLTVFVEDGILSPAEAQLLFLIASNWQAAI